MKYTLPAIFALALPTALPAADPGEAPAGFLPYQDAARLAEGAVIYRDYCASCHGADLEGEPDWRSRNADGSFRAPPHDETGHTWHHPDAQLFAVVKYGTEVVTAGAVQSPMIGFGEILDDDEILSVLAFIKSTWPDHVIARHDEMNRRASVSQ